MACLEASKFTEIIVNKARGAMAAATESELASGREVAVGNVTGNFVHNVQETYEVDLDDQQSEAVTGSGKLVRKLDENEGEAHDDDNGGGKGEVSYIKGVRALMQIIFEYTVSEHRDLKNIPEPCPLCQEDDTIEQKWRVRTKSSQHHQARLTRHNRLNDITIRPVSKII